MSGSLAETELHCAHCDAHIKVANATPTSKVRCPGCRSVFPLSEARPRPVATPPPIATPPVKPTPRRPPVRAAAPRAPSPKPAAEWRLRRKSGEELLSAQAIEDMVRDGRARATDEVLAPNTSKWSAVSEVPDLKTALSLRKKEVESRLRSLARKTDHACYHHAQRKARHVCLSCAYPYCATCASNGNCPDCAAGVATL